MQQVKFIDIPYDDPIVYASTLKNYNFLILFDSAYHHYSSARYSYIGIDPYSTLILKNSKIQIDNQFKENADVFKLIEKKLEVMTLIAHPDLPPFQGGAAGYFSYDLARSIETLPNHAQNDLDLPDIVLGFYDLIISFDHLQKKAWIVSSGFPETEHEKNSKRAESRIAWLLQGIQSSPIKMNDTHNASLITGSIYSNFTKSQYIEAILRCQSYILNGDIFQVNLAQRFECMLSNDIGSFDLYKKIRILNPSPYSAYFNFDDNSIISSSPERFIQMINKKVEARPIKGTIHRAKSSKEDWQFATKLQNCQKNRSENMMIVDLLRNDLSKVCEPQSVKVTSLCQLESFQSVHHLVSVIEGTLREKYSAIDLLKATFPGGSVTGAPKIRAMEIIDNIEPHRRGPYCGSIGYIGFDGTMDLSILIRTFIAKDKRVTFHAGGAIVLDSDPLQEYEETLAKVSILKSALVGDEEWAHNV